MPKILWAKRQKSAKYGHGLEIQDNGYSIQLSLFHHPCLFLQNPI